MNNRQLTKYFKKTYGGYRDKIKGMGILLKNESLNPRNSVFVGDGKADYECAKHHNMYFIGIINNTNNFGNMQDIKWKLYDLTQLPETIEKIDSSNS